MNIYEFGGEKESLMPLLLLGDEQEDMIRRYLHRATIFVLDDDGVRAQCAVTDQGDGILEIKNISVLPQCQRKGYGKALIAFVESRYAGTYRLLQVGTGDSPLTIPFYEHCGFHRSYVVKDFFTRNYDHPIFEGGVQLRDMIYLEKPLT